MAHYWNTKQVAEYLNVHPNSVSMYHTTGYMPAPHHKQGINPRWEPAVVIQWDLQRPGAGGHNKRKGRTGTEQDNG